MNKKDAHITPESLVQASQLHCVSCDVKLKRQRESEEEGGDYVAMTCPTCECTEYVQVKLKDSVIRAKKLLAKRAATLLS